MKTKNEIQTIDAGIEIINGLPRIGDSLDLHRYIDPILIEDGDYLDYDYYAKSVVESLERYNAKLERKKAKTKTAAKKV